MLKEIPDAELMHLYDEGEQLKEKGAFQTSSKLLGLNKKKEKLYGASFDIVTTLNEVYKEMARRWRHNIDNSREK